MGPYARKTRSLRLEILPADFRQALQAHQDEYNLGSILNDYLDCVETVSDKRKKGLFKGPGDQQVTSYAILTPIWLVYAAKGDSGFISVLSVPLAEVVAEDYAQSPYYAKIQDNGFHITGAFTGRVGMHSQRRITIFLPLGEERDAKNFGQALEDAIAKNRR
jgi:hypothetical protein